MENLADLIGAVGDRLAPIGADPRLAGAVVLGALAVAVNARVALVGPALVCVLALAAGNGFAAPDWLVELVPSLVVGSFVLGIMQAAISLVAGREAAATALGVVIGGTLMFVAWYGPRRVLGLLRRRTR